MSLAALAVPTYGSRAPDCFSQPRANNWLSDTTTARCAVLPGAPEVAKYRSSCASDRQCSAGIEPPTPRGSKPTTSNLARTAAEISLRAPIAYWTPEPPGPPGLTTSDPILVPGLAARSRLTGNEDRRHAGRRQSNGTSSRAPW